MFGPKPTSWTFPLDERATAMSLVSTTETGSPVFATPDTVNALIATFPYTAATPPEVVAILDMSRKLLATSVIHYEFAAAGAEKSLQAMELAVRRYLRVDGKPRLDVLIKRLGSSGEFSPEIIDMLDTGRIARNRVFAHPTGAVALPLVLMTGMIRTSHLLVATLFPD